MICGNGGSASDSDHITAELMKSFLIPRPLDSSEIDKFKQLYGAKGSDLATKLEKTLPAIPLVNNTALITAIANDIDPSMIFAQQVYGYGKRGDTLIAISTSGNSENVINAVKVAKAIGIKTIILTGNNKGKLTKLSDIKIEVPSSETLIIQEYHIAIYHALCACVERTIFKPRSEI
ncbi:D-sedoheptulose-7-phosphate isomerase [Cytobacillus pseudoceanisediminis]|uniref:D-sedoheptulose-7-phosphate isomerase n=1 Tax=Cytobacillus pseudoceanisediminis TaxID=3051614 RepID=UPI003C2AB082